MFSMCSELTPRAHIPDTRIPQLMQPWFGHCTVCTICTVCNQGGIRVGCVADNLRQSSKLCQSHSSRDRDSKVLRPNCFQKQVDRGTWLTQRTSLTLFVRHNICKKSYATWFSRQTFYCVKVRNLWHNSLRMDGGLFSQCACSWWRGCCDVSK